MATNTTITTTYAGEKLQGFISAALLSANTIENGGVSVKPNVKFKAVIKSLATGTLIADDTCDFTDSSSVTLDERILEPETFQVNLQLCKDDFVLTGMLSLWGILHSIAYLHLSLII